MDIFVEKQDFRETESFFSDGRNEGAKDKMLHDAFDGHHSRKWVLLVIKIDTELMLKSYKLIYLCYFVLM